MARTKASEQKKSTSYPRKKGAARPGPAVKKAIVRSGASSSLTPTQRISSGSSNGASSGGGHGSGSGNGTPPSPEIQTRKRPKVWPPVKREVKRAKVERPRPTKAQLRREWREDLTNAFRRHYQTLRHDWQRKALLKTAWAVARISGPSILPELVAPPVYGRQEVAPEGLLELLNEMEAQHNMGRDDVYDEKAEAIVYTPPDYVFDDDTMW